MDAFTASQKKRLIGKPHPKIPKNNKVNENTNNNNNNNEEEEEEGLTEEKLASREGRI